MCTLTWSTSEAVTPEQVDEVGRCNVQVDVLQIQQNCKPERPRDVLALKVKYTANI